MISATLLTMSAACSSMVSPKSASTSSGVQDVVGHHVADVGGKLARLTREHTLPPQDRGNADEFLWVEDHLHPGPVGHPPDERGDQRYGNQDPQHVVHQL
jgi:hypothetical protein